MALSVLMDFDSPLSPIMRFSSFIPALDEQDLVKLVQIHLLQLSMATNMKRTLTFSEIRGPKKSRWISSFTFSGVVNLFFSVCGSHVLTFLPNLKPTMQSAAFVARSARWPEEEFGYIEHLVQAAVVTVGNLHYPLS